MKCIANAAFMTLEHNDIVSHNLQHFQLSLPVSNSGKWLPIYTSVIDWLLDNML